MVFIYLFIDGVANTPQTSGQKKQTKINKTKHITKLACHIDWGYISYLALLFIWLLTIEGNFGRELQLIKKFEKV